MGDYEDETKVLLKNKFNNNELENLLKNKDWHEAEGGYYFSTIWGASFMEPPLGEKPNEMRFLTVKVFPDNDTIYIYSGRW